MISKSVIGKASSVTPVPGGVGPMTITMLLYNTVLAAQLSRKLTQLFKNIYTYCSKIFFGKTFE